jgi:hypothetical protein
LAFSTRSSSCWIGGNIISRLKRKNKIINKNLLEVKTDLKKSVEKAYWWFLDGERFLFLLNGGFSSFLCSHLESLSKLHSKIKDVFVRNWI